MKQILILLSIAFHFSTTFSQTSHVEINLQDSNGKKNGFWIEVSDAYKIETYYLHGIKNGIEKVYFRNGTLRCFFEYKNGHTISTGYFFHDKGYIEYTIKYLGFVIYKNKKMQKGYFTSYYPDGSIEERGIALFVEGDEELGEEIRTGKWEKFSSTTQK